MMKLKMLIILLYIPFTYESQGQDSKLKQDIYAAYTNLVAGKWETKGKWASGGEFHQVVDVEHDLSGNIFTVRTYDHIDSKKFNHSQRNFGIRAWDKNEKKMKFWEFDVFGGITEGEVFSKGHDIYLTYEYRSRNGSVMQLADIWIYQDTNTYTFRVCEYSNGQVGRELMSTTYKRIGP